MVVVRLRCGGPFAAGFSLVAFAFAVAVADDLPTCLPKDFHFEYTECDKYGGRWRVSVPKPSVCVGGTPNAPVRGKDCKFTCEAGKYLDVQGDQSCHSCPPGTYSLGGGIRFDNWDHVPLGFYLKTEGVSEIGFMSREEVSPERTNCSKAAWIPKGNYIIASPQQCSTTLMYTATLVQPGSVSFEYQYNEASALFNFMMQNDQCQTIADDHKLNQYPPNTEEGQWHEINFPLKTGLNVLFWKVIGLLPEEEETSLSSVKIRKIEIRGVAYTSECTKCPNGTYSSGGTSFCTECPINTHSERGAFQCKDCDKETHYSGKGANKCLKRHPCTEMDYYEYQTPCDKNKQTQTKYKWMEPQICRTDLPEAVQLPPAGELKVCPLCNPGMQYVNGSDCTFCPINHYSDGSSPCKGCPVSTSPVYGHQYKWWYSMPDNISSHCLNFEERKCMTNSGWIPSGDYIETKYGLGEAGYLLLVFNVAGFRGKAAVMDGKADFQDSRPNVVKKWFGSQQKQSFIYTVKQNKSIKFSWIFVHTQWDDLSKSDISQHYIIDYARIYSIEATNTIGGGASTCQKCPRGTQHDGCIPCPNGHYIDPNTIHCTPCPPGTVVHSGNAWGKESCKACGHGLRAVGGRICVSDCKFTDDKNRQYNFNELSGFQHITGGHLFTSTGTQYYHGFNISLCGNKEAPQSMCVNNVSTLPNEPLVGPRVLTTTICRSTLIPSRNGKRIVSTQPVSLGEHLLEITNSENMTNYYREAGFSDSDSNLDIHFHYKAENPTPACPHGRTTIITLRCDVNENHLGTIDLPPKCPDGTCDGCMFHFMWRSKHACPVCKDKDYIVIKGECKTGEQTIHYYPPKHCMLLGGQKPMTKKQKCSMIPFAIEVGIMCTLSVGILLLLLVIYCWKKNRKLEYKYMKLVESSGERELPAAETCALDDGEEEHFDDVSFPEAGRGKSFLKRLRSKIRQKNDNSFQSIKLSEKCPLT